MQEVTDGPNRVLDVAARRCTMISRSRVLDWMHEYGLIARMHSNQPIALYRQARQAHDIAADMASHGFELRVQE